MINLFNPSLWNRPNVFHIVVEVLSVMTLGLVYLFVALKAAAGAFGVGSVTQYVGAITIMLNSITTLIRESGNVKLNIPYLQRNFELLDAPERMYKGSLSTEKRNDRKFEIEFRNVSFRYPDTERYVLKNINFRFTIGERLAIVGENGSGKSTFIKLLCRLYDPTEGEILLALRMNPVALDMDGVKRRTRSGMGRCQGGFCGPYVMQLIAKEREINMEDVTKYGGDSRMVFGKAGEV